MGIYFGQPFGHYPTFYALLIVGLKKLSVCQKNVAAFSCQCYFLYLFILLVIMFFVILFKNFYAFWFISFNYLRNFLFAFLLR